MNIDSESNIALPPQQNPAGEAGPPPSTAALSHAAPLATSSAPPLRVEGLAETLHDVRHELNLISHASKYNWINQRLILLRNSIIAVSILAVAILVVVACYREAYRQTMTIAAFEVPQSLAVRGITGQVLAKALFDELIKRRKTVTTLDAGELKGAWAENRADVAIPEAKFTLQSVFRHLRYLTGNEIAVDGEIILDGDDAILKVRVAGHPPTVVRGKFTQWEALVGDLANGVLEVTQPAVLAAYLGTKAETAADIDALSKHIRRIELGSDKPSREVLSVAYEAYGRALARIGREKEALAAFKVAMSYDPANGVAVMRAADAYHDARDYVISEPLYARVEKMKLPDTVRRAALRNRIHSARLRGDCPAAIVAVAAAKASPSYQSAHFDDGAAFVLSRCEFEEARAVAIVSELVLLHPDSNAAISLGGIQVFRPEWRYVDEGIAAYRAGIAAGSTLSGLHLNLSLALARKGQYAEAFEALREYERISKRRASPPFRAFIHLRKGEYQAADDILKEFFRVAPPSEVIQFLILADTKVGLGQFDEAEAAYKAGLTLLPQNCDLLHNLGTLYVKKREMDKALTQFETGIKTVPKCGLNYNSAARMLIQQNRAPEAKQKLDALIKIAPTSDGAVIAKEILASIGKGA